MLHPNAIFQLDWIYAIACLSDRQRVPWFRIKTDPRHIFEPHCGVQMPKATRFMVCGMFGSVHMFHRPCEQGSELLSWWVPKPNGPRFRQNQSAIIRGKQLGTLAHIAITLLTRNAASQCNISAWLNFCRCIFAWYNFTEGPFRGSASKHTLATYSNLTAVIESGGPPGLWYAAGLVRSIHFAHHLVSPLECGQGIL